MSSEEHIMARAIHAAPHDSSEESPLKRLRAAAGLESGRQASMETQGIMSNPGHCDEADEPCTKSGRPGRSVLSHVATEQRRRDKINEGFVALRELIPHKDKMDKATFLQQAVEYIRQLQAVMQQLLSMGAINGLPEDIQWAIRMLLPRGGDIKPAASTQQVTGGQQAAAKPAEAALSQLVPSTAYLPYMLQPQQLAVLTQHAQQAKSSASDAAKPATVPSMDLNQLQTLMQQQQAAQQLQVQQAARAGMWPADQATLWQLAQLQQMMQGAGQAASHMPQCSMGGLSQEALSSLAQMQAFQSMFSQGPNAAAAAVPAPGQASASPPALPATGCAAAANAPPQFCGGSGQLPIIPAKARKSSTKLRKHTSAAKIAKPEAVRPTAQPPVGRPDAMSMIQQM